MAVRFPSGPSTRPEIPLFPREQRVSPDRPGAVQGAKRRSEPLTARTDLESFSEREKGNYNKRGLHTGGTFKGFGVAKRYCRRDSIGARFLQGRSVRAMFPDPPGMGRLGIERAGKQGRETMIRKKWRDGEPVLSVETEDEFWKAVSTGEAVEVTRELREKMGLMEDDTISEAEANAARYDPSE